MVIGKSHSTQEIINPLSLARKGPPTSPRESYLNQRSSGNSSLICKKTEPGHKDEYSFMEFLVIIAGLDGLVGDKGIFDS